MDKKEECLKVISENLSVIVEDPLKWYEDVSFCINSLLRSEGQEDCLPHCMKTLVFFQDLCFEVLKVKHGITEK